MGGLLKDENLVYDHIVEDEQLLSPEVTIDILNSTLNLTKVSHSDIMTNSQLGTNGTATGDISCVSSRFHLLLVWFIKSFYHIDSHTFL